MSNSKTIFSKDELARYNRHIIIPDFGIEAQTKLKESRVLVIGSGGLGSPLLLYLAAAGVGTLGIVDFDVVDDSNLQRQVLFGVFHFSFGRTATNPPLNQPINTSTNQHQRAILNKRIKVPPSINQFTQTLGQNSGAPVVSCRVVSCPVCRL